MAFIQTMTVQATSTQPLADLLDDWHRDQTGSAPGYQGARLLADRDQPGRFVVEVSFSSEEEASRNNARAETQAWAEKLQGLAQDTPTYHNYDAAYTSG